MTDRHSLWKPPRGITLRDIVIDRMALGPSVVRGTLWPSGERFAATLWAISGRPGGERIMQVIYTDRGSYRTGLDAYEMATVLMPLADEENLNGREDRDAA